MQNRDGQSVQKTVESIEDKKAYVPEPEPKASLGIGTLVSETFTIVFERWFLVIVLGFVPTFIGQLVSSFLAGANLTLASQQLAYSGLTGNFASILAGLISIAAMSITFALLVQYAYDANLHRPLALKRYIATAFRTLLPNAALNMVIFLVLGLVAFTLATAAGAANLSLVVLIPILLVALLWVYSVFSVTIPAVVISRAGFSGILRSFHLTKDYRWPIVAAITLTIFFIVILSFVLGFFVFFFGMSGGFIGVILSILVLASISSLASGLLSVLITLIFARLCEIKEGTTMEQIAGVFD